MAICPNLYGQTIVFATSNISFPARPLLSMELSTPYEPDSVADRRMPSPLGYLTEQYPSHRYASLPKGHVTVDRERERAVAGISATSRRSTLSGWEDFPRRPGRDPVAPRRKACSGRIGAPSRS